jgi:hypothetical protein
VRVVAAPRETHLPSRTGADDRPHQLVDRRRTEAHLRLAEARRRRGQAEITQGREIAATPERRPVHRRDEGLREGVHAPVIGDRVGEYLGHVARGELGAIEARAEGLSRTGQDDNPDAVALLELVEPMDDLLPERARERVSLVGAVERQNGDAVGLFEVHE